MRCNNGELTYGPAVSVGRPLPQIHENLAVLHAYINNQLHKFRFARDTSS
jgi:hypothetical protein